MPNIFVLYVCMAESNWERANVVFSIQKPYWIRKQNKTKTIHMKMYTDSWVQLCTSTFHERITLCYCWRFFSSLFLFLVPCSCWCCGRSRCFYCCLYFVVETRLWNGIEYLLCLRKFSIVVYLFLVRQYIFFIFIFHFGVFNLPKPKTNNTLSDWLVFSW